MLLYFSGCGNSHFVATELARLTSQRLEKIDPNAATPSLQLEDDEILGIVCPVYAWAVPRLVSEYISRLTINKVPNYIFLACTCGDNVGRTAERFASLLKKKGLHLDAAFSFIMPETYINMPGFNLDNPENANRKIEAVKQRLLMVAEKINERLRVVDVVPGKIPWVNTYIVNPLFYGFLITDKKFHVTADCTHCGLCAKSCPLGNIVMEGGLPSWQGHCTNCMSCYHRCPTNAIHFGKATIGKGQYTFPSNNRSRR